MGYFNKNSGKIIIKVASLLFISKLMLDLNYSNAQTFIGGKKIQRGGMKATSFCGTNSGWGSGNNTSGGGNPSGSGTPNSSGTPSGSSTSSSSGTPSGSSTSSSSGTPSGSSSGGGPSATNSNFTTADRKSCVDYVNTTYRAPAGLAAFNESSELEGDADAGIAYDQANGGIVDSSGNFIPGLPGVHKHARTINVGENMWGSSPGSYSYLSACTQAVDDWWNEYKILGVQAGAKCPDNLDSDTYEKVGHYCNLVGTYSSAGAGGAMVNGMLIIYMDYK